MCIGELQCALASVGMHWQASVCFGELQCALASFNLHWRASVCIGDQALMYFVSLTQYLILILQMKTEFHIKGTDITKVKNMGLRLSNLIQRKIRFDEVKNSITFYSRLHMPKVSLQGHTCIETNFISSPEPKAHR